MHRPARSTLVALLLLAALAPAAAAADGPALDTLEAALRRVAAEATPKTVCVRIRLADGHEGFGSGAIVSGDGLVLTCAHVTEPAKGGSLTAVFPDGAEATMTVVASNAKNDYALCRLTTGRKDLPHFTFAPQEPRLGDWVVGLGHPGGPYADHRPTVAAGKVTALDRSLPILMEGKAYVGAIQTDAPLFGGNSGGPLVDLEGRLVGINGAILLVGDGSFASSGVRIAKDLPALAAGKDVEGEEIDDLFAALSGMTGEMDPDELAEAFADENLREMLRAMGPMMRLAGRAEGTERAARRLDDLRAGVAATGRALPPGGDLLADGVVVGKVTPVGRRGGRALFVTSARAARSPGTLTVRGAGLAAPTAARVRGVDGAWDLGLLDVASPGEDVAFPRTAPATDVVPGSIVLLPGADGTPVQGGVLAATDRAVGTERRIPTIGIVRLFQPPHTSPFRPYPALLQIDAPIEADESGWMVVRPDGALLGVAVAHFNRGATMVVPAAVLPARVERMLAGVDDPAPEGYGPPPRPAPDRARAAAKVRAREARRASMTLYVPTLAGVLKPVALSEGEASPAPTVVSDSGGGPLDLLGADVLVSVGGAPTGSVAAAEAAIAALATGAKVPVVVRRGDRDVVYEGTAEGEGRGRKLALRALVK
ncbi:MAG: trypsin-like peptidase domain-containing protein [Planctomycetota bacterium]